MVGLSRPTNQSKNTPVSLIPAKQPHLFSGIPTIDLKTPEAKSLIVKACEDMGFFSLTNHGVPMEAISELESQALDFFSLPLTLKQRAGPPNPFGYSNKRIGRNDDVGWIEYLLLTTNPEYNSLRLSPVLGTNPEKFQRALKNYISYVRKIACEVLELLAEGLNIQQRNVWSKMVMNEQSDSVFRFNHYPQCPEFVAGSANNGGNMVGFGEHTDPQIISVLRSNNASGLEVCLRDGTWVSVPPDQSSFFINVGDLLQVMTNGRLKSARHRVMANGLKSRVSMIYFCAPPLSETIAPLPSLINQQSCLYKQFSWFEFKKAAYASRLSDNRLALFEIFPSTQP